MTIGWIVIIALCFLVFTDIGALFGMRREGKVKREEEDKKYSFKQFKKK